MAFNPQMLGFEELQKGYGEKKRIDYCYIIISSTKRGGQRVPTARLVLDEETAVVVSDMFGERVGVAIDEDARIVLYAGSTRKLSSMVRGTKDDQLKRTISLESEATSLVKKLGQFRHYKYDAKIWAKGEAVLLTPAEKID